MSSGKLRVQYKTLTFAEKFAIIREVEKGVKKKCEIAKNYGIPLTTLSTFLKNKDKILITASSGNGKDRKRVRKPDNPEVDECVLKWFKQSQDENIPLSGSLIRAKAEEFSANLGKSDFKASTGWLCGFKRRHGIFFKSACGESASVDQESACVWKDTVLKMIKDSQAEDIFNADDTGLKQQHSGPKQAQSGPKQPHARPKQPHSGPSTSATFPSTVIPVSSVPPSDVKSVAKPVPSRPLPINAPLPTSVPLPKSAPLHPPPITTPPLCPPTRDERSINVQWNSYATNMCTIIPNLLEDEKFVDVTLACDGKYVKCHKVILGACSTYFEELLSINPCKHPIILLKGFQFWEIQAIINFMYRGLVNIPQHKLPKLLKAAKALQIKGLMGTKSENETAEDESVISEVTTADAAPKTSLKLKSLLTTSKRKAKNTINKRDSPPACELPKSPPQEPSMKRVKMVSSFCHKELHSEPVSPAATLSPPHDPGLCLFEDTSPIESIQIKEEQLFDMDSSIQVFSMNEQDVHSRPNDDDSSIIRQSEILKSLTTIKEEVDEAFDIDDSTQVSSEDDQDLSDRLKNDNLSTPRQFEILTLPALTNFKEELEDESNSEDSTDPLEPPS